MSNSHPDNSIPVRDKPAETGIQLSNIIQFLILCVMSWVGYNIEFLKHRMGELSATSQVNGTNITQQNKRVDDLRTDFIMHMRKHH